MLAGLPRRKMKEFLGFGLSTRAIARRGAPGSVQLRASTSRRRVEVLSSSWRFRSCAVAAKPRAVGESGAEWKDSGVAIADGRLVSGEESTGGTPVPRISRRR